MRLKKLIDIVAKGFYDAHLVKEAEELEGERCGDTLALFVLREVHDAYEPGTGDIAQLEAAQEAIGKASEDLNDVFLALAHKISDIERAKLGLSSLYGKMGKKRRTK